MRDASQFCATDVSDDRLGVSAPYLLLINQHASQRKHDLYEVIYAMRWLVRAGEPWHMVASRPVALAGRVSAKPPLIRSRVLSRNRGDANVVLVGICRCWIDTKDFCVSAFMTIYSSRRGQLWRMLLIGFFLWLLLKPGAQSSSNAVRSVAASPRASMPSSGQELTTLPSHVERPELEVAQRNPFIPKAAPLPEPPPPVVVPVVAIAPEPSIPMLNMQFTGRMTAPDGTQRVFAKIDGQDIQLAASLQLNNGYQVVSTNAEAVEFSHPALKAHQRMELPPPPAFEVR